MLVQYIALSLIPGGPSPNFLPPPVAGYIVHGVHSVQATPQDVPVSEMREKILKVKLTMVDCMFIIIGH